MNDYDGTTTILNVSGDKIDNNCLNVLKFMQKTGLNCHIVPNKTVIGDKIENGCIITLAGVKPDIIEKKVWKNLEKEFDLKCAFMEMKRDYAGCVRNFFRPSNCIT